MDTSCNVTEDFKMWNTKTIERNCDCCGKKYITKSHKSKYCGAECKKKSAKKNNKKKKVVRKNNTNRELMDYAAEARKAGISYGEYVARMEYRRCQEKEKVQ